MGKRAIALLLALWAVPVLAAPVTFESLLAEMTSLEFLTRAPDPAYTCKQFSSYDQRSTDPAVLTDENWFANGDRGQYLRKEQRNGQEEYVLADVAGPGALVRFWSANPVDAGTVYVYLDGEKAPSIEMPLTEMLGGGKAPFIKPISIELAKGWNSYLPIPYAKHLKVTTSKPNFYYHINYRTYAKGTKVKTYDPAKVATLMPQIEAVAKALERPETAIPMDAGAEEVAGELEIAPGASEELGVGMGPGAIVSITAKVEAKDLEAALRGTLLEITFDGQASPSVVTPLGDFFGTAPGNHRFATLPCGVLADGSFYAHWVMPFQQGAVLRLRNTTQETVRIQGAILSGAREWTDDSLYFHAKWRGARDVPTQPRQDFNFLDATGAGRFVGVLMHVTNPVADWWGEGDEKIYVDGEKFPSHFGTGTEDYFGYAWCSPEVYTQAYHAQSRCDGPGNFGQTANNRFHILDNIPFTSSFRFDMEVWHWVDCRIAQSVVAYWYAKPGGKDTFPVPQAADLIVPVPPKIKGVEGAIEGEGLKVLGISGGTHTIQGGMGHLWSLTQQLWWMDGKPGDTLVLAFPVEKAGRYEVLANLTKAVDYGIATFTLNDGPASAPMDFWIKKHVKATGEIPLGTADLKAGENRLTITLTGANPEAKPSHMIGLDYLRLVAK